MFGWQLTIPVDISEKERSPPPRPVAPEFPKYTPIHTKALLTELSSRSLLQDIARLRTPADIERRHVDCLNVRITPDVPLEDLIPSDHANQDRPFLHDDVLTLALEGIRISNDDAFLSVLRVPTKDGEPKRPILGNAHAFFLGLEQMSHYWDSSKDNYYEVPDTAPLEDLVPGSGDTDNSTDGSKMPDEENLQESRAMKMKEVYKGRRSGNGESMPADFLARTVKAFLDIPRIAFRIATYERRNPAQLVIRNFKMPIALRYDVGLVPEDRKLARLERLEGPIMGVHARAENKFNSGRGDDGEASHAEIVDCYREIGALLLLAQKRTRAGKTEVLLGQDKWWCRKRRWGGGTGGHMPHESDEEPTEDPSKPKPTTLKSPEQQNGPPSEESGVEDSVSKPLSKRTLRSDLKRTAEDSHDDNENENGKTLNDSTGSRKRRSPPQDAIPPVNSNLNGATKPDDAETLPLLKKKKSPGPRARALLDAYRRLKPPPSLWDEHIKYRAIGRRGCTNGPADAAAAFDDVYLISAVNYHISFLHARVSTAYVRWLEEGSDVPHDLHGDGGKENGEREDTLYIQRSRWFDLFEAEDRTEALVGLWRILGWIFREQESKVKEEG